MKPLNDLDLGVKLAETDMSSVYRGSYQGKPAILKRLSAKRNDAKGRGRFALEFAMIQECQSQHIPQALVLTEVDGFPLQIYADIGGQSLASLVDSGKVFSIDDLLHIAKATALALSEMHRRQIIHKDVNPANIILNIDTKSLQLIDFGIATKLSQESQDADHIMQLEGSLSYLSPEQTGRMQRSVDFRSDFFSLGATLYELATRQRAFSGKDAAETIHRILASQPARPESLRRDLPPVLAKLIWKLMEKAPESRYNSDFGLLHDLDRAIAGFSSNGTGFDFELGEHDDSDRFEVPEKLYGRSAQLKVLSEAFARACNGANEFVQIAGPSGIGKSSLVNELKTPILGQRGYYISGKFDQFKKNIPFYAITHALDQLLSAVLKEGQEALNQWHHSISLALDELKPVAAEFLSKLPLIIGAQPPPTPAEPERAKQRLMQAIERLVSVFATVDHPLVWFLDDLQWADSGSLDTLTALTCSPSLKHLLLIGAYRDDELDINHPTSVELSTIDKTRGSSVRLQVAALDGQSITALVADTLKTDHSEVAALAALIEQKTQGNAFFIRTFLTHLFEKKIFSYVHDQCRWTWNLESLAHSDVTDNVATILLSKIGDLPKASAKALTYAACIGPQFDIANLALLLELEPAVVAKDLWPAVVQGFLVPLSSDYKVVASIPTAESSSFLRDYSKISLRFSHDRVQRAAHDIIDESLRQTVHYQIGRILLRSLSPADRAAQIFLIADHLNYAPATLTSEAERLDLATIDLQAAAQAQASGAYQVAVSYYQAALKLVGDQAWDSHYQIVATAYMGLGRAYHAMDQYDLGLSLLTVAEAKLKTAMEKAQALELIGSYHETHTEYLKCIRACLKGLSLLGVHISEQAHDAKLLATVGWFKALWMKRTIRYLEDDNASDDPRWRMIFMLATRMGSSAFFYKQNLFVIMYLRLFVQAQKEGASLSYPGQTALLGMVSFIIRDKKSALKFRQLAQKIVAKGHDPASLPIYYALDGHWMAAIDQDYKELARITEAGYKKGLEIGDLAFAGVAGFLTMLNSISGGFRLPELEALAERLEHFFLVVNPKNHFTGAFLPIAQLVKNFAGKTDSPMTMSGGSITETAIVQRTAGTPGHLSIYKTMSAWLKFNRQDYQGAARLGLTNLVQYALPGCFSAAINASVTVISLMRARRLGTPVFRFRPLESLIVNLLLLELRWWSTLKTISNGLYEMAKAEQLRSHNKHHRAKSAVAAINMYERAITQFSASKQYFWVAQAHESLGRFYQDLGMRLPAKAHVQESIERYKQYGAATSALSLTQEFKQLLDERQQSGTGNTIAKDTAVTTTRSLDLDFESIVKASQTISGQMDLDRLVTDILHIAMENAGATHGSLLIGDQERLSIEVSGTMNGHAFEGQTIGIELDKGSHDYIPASVAHYVQRSQQELVLNALGLDSDYAADPYVEAHRPKAIICLPIVTQQKLGGVLFLENRLVEGAFTDERIASLKILASQAAIALANARYVHDLRQSAERIHHLKGQLEKILAGTKDMAASQSLEQAAQFALTTMTAEIDRLRGASCHVFLRDNHDGNFHLHTFSSTEKAPSAPAKALPQIEQWHAYLDATGPAAVGESTLVIPVRWQLETVALFIFEGLASNTLTSEDAQFVATLVQSLGLSLKNIEHQEHLEAMVEQRTHALNASLLELTAKKEKIQAILDNIDQGIVTFDESLAIEPDFSAFVTQFFHEDPTTVPGRSVVDLVLKPSRLGSDRIKQVEEILHVVLGNDDVNWALNGSRLPNEMLLEVAGKQHIVATDWKPMIKDDLVSKMMLTLRDITAQRQLEQKIALQEAEQSRKMALLSKMLLVRRSNLHEFIRESTDRIKSVEDQLNAPKPSLDTIFGQLHTIKGLSRILAFEELTNLVHDAESHLSQVMTQAERHDNRDDLLFTSLKSSIDAVSDWLLGLNKLYQDVFKSEDKSDGQRWSLHSFASLVFPNLVDRLAAENMTLEHFVVQDHIAHWDEVTRSSLQMMLTHCVTNALDHGYILPRHNGRTTGNVAIELVAYEDDSQARIIQVCDRGVGLDHEKLRILAKKMGRNDLADSKPEEILFETGASTAQTVSTTSGRGVGLGAVRRAARDLGGDAQIRARRDGTGTIFEISLPPVAKAQDTRLPRAG